MTNKEEVRNLVIIGAWNTLLISPQWLNNYVFDGELEDKIDVKLEINGNNVISRVYDLPDFKLEVSPSRLCFILRQLNDQHFNILHEKVLRILNTLQHTPLQAIGVNYVFLENNTEYFKLMRNKYNNLNFANSEEILNVNGDGDGDSYRLLIRENNESTEFDFNFNYLIPDIAKAKEILTASIFMDKFNKGQKIVRELLEQSHEDSGS